MSRMIFRTVMAFVWCSLFLLVTGMLSASELTISRTRITAAGPAQTLRANAGAYCEFELRNDGEKDRVVKIRIASEKKQTDPEAYFSAEFFAPAHSTQRTSMLFQLDGSREYIISSNDCRISDPYIRIYPMKPGEAAYGLIADRASRFIQFSSNPGFKKQNMIFRLYSTDVPMDADSLENFRMLVFHQTDFTRWHAASFEAVREYVKRGGTILFLSPEIAYQASLTPLAELVPAIPDPAADPEMIPASVLESMFGILEIEKTPSLLYPAKLRSGAKALSATPDGKIIFAEKDYEKGSCRVSMIDLGGEKFHYMGAGWDKIISRLLTVPAVAPRKLVYEHKTLPDGASSFLQFAMPEGKRLFGMLLVVAAGAILLTIISVFIKSRLLAWGLILLWLALSVGAGFYNQGELYDKVPVDTINHLISGGNE